MISYDFLFGLVIGSTAVYITATIGVWLMRGTINDALREIKAKPKKRRA